MFLDIKNLDFKYIYSSLRLYIIAQFKLDEKENDLL